MKKLSKSTWFFSAIVAALVFIVCYAVLCPKIYLSPELQSSFNTAPDGRLLHSAKRYIFVAFATAASFIASIFFDNIAKFSSKIYEAIKENKITLAKRVIAFSAAILAGVFTEILYRVIFGTDSLGLYFNLSSATTFSMLYLLVAIIVTEYHDFGKAPEKAVALMILILGVFIILVQPFSYTSWDLETHYPWALQNSFVGTAFYNTGDDAIDLFEKMIFTIGERGENIDLASSEFIKARMNALPETIIIAKPVEFSLPHVPSGIAIAVSRLFGANFYTRYCMGELASLLVYTTLTYFAIKRLKSGKMIMSIVAMLPTSVFIVSNYSYDGWVTGFAFLGTAYFMSELEQPKKPMRTRDIVIMAASFAFASLPKLIYVLMFSLLLFMRKENWGEKGRRKYYTIVAIIFLITLAMFAVRSLSVVSSSGDTRGGAVNPARQIAYIFNDPLRYTKILTSFFLDYISPSKAYKYISYFNFLKTVYGVQYVYLILMGFCALTDKEECNNFKTRKIVRIGAVVSQFALILLIATALYIDFNAVGRTSLKGCQSRYLIPLLPPILLTISNPGIRLKIFRDKKIYNIVIFSILSLMGMAITHILIGSKMM